ncbi:hypothetical protein MYP_2198 [Sporocytophaga myxococcoides]|uniref:DUF177 domain-containing protein n=2 Tax=Sporocytophaga myxococcoides TaxID=153721 RepID=A0A098LDG1_9BACT|nr:hypothetical protein MYP_2198 [Sporocytophaga myxococcoides]
MKGLRTFDIEIVSLSNSKHYYDYTLDSTFFENFEDSLLEKGQLKVTVMLNKSETMIQASIAVEGWVELICDRSLDPFEYQINTNDQIIFKYGKEYAEISEEIITIPFETQKLNLSQFIYEFIGLAVPMKKLHPKFIKEEEEENDEEETLLIYSTPIDLDEDELKDDEIDPRWDILNKLKK